MARPFLHRTDGSVRGALTISDRQRAAVERLRNGELARDIAAELGVSHRTVLGWSQRIRQAEEDAANTRESCR